MRFFSFQNFWASRACDAGPTWRWLWNMSVEDEIILPGLVGEPGAASAVGGPEISLAPSIPADTEREVNSDDEEVSGRG